MQEHFLANPEEILWDCWRSLWDTQHQFHGLSFKESSYKRGGETLVWSKFYNAPLSHLHLCFRIIFY